MLEARILLTLGKTAAAFAMASPSSVLRPLAAPPPPLPAKWVTLNLSTHSFMARNVGEAPLLRSRWRGFLGPVAGGGPSPAAVAAGNYNVQVVVGEDEPDEEVVRRFRGLVLRAGIIQECKRRRFFEDKQAEQKRRRRDAAKRNRRRRSWSRKPPPVGKKQNEPKDDGEEEDNWELPAGEPPY
ncbi:unnamed protein product [Spirodela intermedia]|uniref:Uncharacterized protein n=1 Tax=Spirodela intermedia TaxID=51605 RepID=A0A7I8KDP8_SPIIN|nr:unnamed protein product [Spirodela intermedia]